MTLHRPPRRFLWLTVPVAGAALLCGALWARAPHTQSTTAGLTLYSIGNPSGDETEILAEINRSRANPSAEGQRLAATLGPDDFADLAQYQAVVNELLTSFGAYPARPPLAFHADLNASAQAHVADMIATGIQQHDSSDGTVWFWRIKSFGYPGGANGENIAGSPYYDPPYVASPWWVESNYEIDL